MRDGGVALFWEKGSLLITPLESHFIQETEKTQKLVV